MIIKIKHPEKNLTLLIEAKVGSTVYTGINRFHDLIDVYNPLHFKYNNLPVQAHYFVALHNGDTDPIEDLELPDEELRSCLSPFYAPSMDAIIQCFLDTGNIKGDYEYDTYKLSYI